MGFFTYPVDDLRAEATQGRQTGFLQKRRLAKIALNAQKKPHTVNEFPHLILPGN